MTICTYWPWFKFRPPGFHMPNDKFDIYFFNLNCAFIVNCGGKKCQSDIFKAALAVS